MELTTDTIKELSEVIVGPAVEVFKAMDRTMGASNEIRPVEKEILRVCQFVGVSGRYEGRLVDNPDYTHCLSEKDSELFFDLKHARLVSMGYSGLKKGQCPILIAEKRQREAKFRMVDKAEPITGLDRESLLRDMDLFEEYINILLSIGAQNMN